MRGPAAGGVQDELFHDFGMMHREIGGDPTTQRFPGDHRAVATKHLQDGADVVGIVLDLIIDRWLIGPAVPEHVDRDEPEFLAMRAEIARIGLGMATHAVQRQHQRLGRIARLDIARPYAVRVKEPLAEADAAQIGPDAGEILGAFVRHDAILFVAWMWRMAASAARSRFSAMSALATAECLRHATWPSGRTRRAPPSSISRTRCQSQ